MQHPAAADHRVDAADGGAVAGHRRQSTGQGVMEGQAFCAGVACQLSHCRQKVAKSSASSRHGSVTGWLTPGQLAASASSRQAASPS